MAKYNEEKFRSELYKKYEECKKILIPKEEYFKMIEEIREAASTSSSKSRRDYYLLSNYEILRCGDVEKLIKKRHNEENDILYYVSIEETYDVIKRAHLATGHGGRDMLKELRKKYANITEHALRLFKSLCQECQKKRTRSVTKGVVVRPILSHEFNSRGQVDLIDMQSMANKAFKWILVYQDHLTKFVILRALTSKRAAEVAHHLLDIFLLFGAPSILQSDNGSEFTAEVINELKVMWPELVMVHGKPRHPQSQGSVERANCDIKDMLVAWMSDNQTDEWSVGIKFVQFKKNASLHSGIKRSPYSAMFGCEVKVGLTSSSLPHEFINRLQNEDDLSVLGQGQDSGNITQTLDLPQQILEHPEENISIHNENREEDMSATQNQEEEIVVSTRNQEEEMVATRILRITNERSHAEIAQLEQAERMVKRSRIKIAHAQIGDNVTIPIPLVDRGRGDPRNILGVIIDRDENDMYTIAVKCGILNFKYCRNQFDVCQQHFLDESNVNLSQKIGLRQAVINESRTGGQGYIRCHCAGSRRCESNICKCFKSKLKCSSRCHSSLACKNK